MNTQGELLLLQKLIDGLFEYADSDMTYEQKLQLIKSELTDVYIQKSYLEGQVSVLQQNKAPKI